MANIGTDGVVLGRLDRTPYQKLLIELAGPERFLVDLYTDPEPVTELMDAMNRRMDEAFEMVLESHVEAIWQPDNITSALTPPRAFEQYCMPFYKMRGPRLKNLGKPYLVHMDGVLRPIAAMIERAVFDGVESLSFPEVGGDYTLADAQKTWPEKVILPNFPSSLCYNTDEQIKAYLTSLWNSADKTKPFMLQLSEDVPSSEWQRVLPTLCRSAQRHGRSN